MVKRWSILFSIFNIVYYFKIVNGFIELIEQYNQIYHKNDNILILNSFIYNLLIDAD